MRSGEFSFLYSLLVLIILAFADTSLGNPNTNCQVSTRWHMPKGLHESSGLAFDRERGRLYQINDSGNAAEVWKTDLQGNQVQQIPLEGVENIDFEDLSLGLCPGKTDEKCLYVPDIGDNLHMRTEIRLHILDLQQLASQSSVKPLASISLRYPDHAHNAESFAVHPAYPYAYLLTKETDGLIFKSVAPSKIYRIDLNSISTTLVEVGDLDMGALAGDPDALPTAMEFSPDGEWLYILTYKNILVIKNTGWANAQAPFPTTWERDKNFFVIQIEVLKQMEALTFIGPDQFIVTSEGKKQDALIYNCHPTIQPHQ